MKRSRLALSLVLGILAVLATVDRWPIGGRGAAADLPITLADRLCPADFADDRMCTEPFQWFGDSGNRRDVEHTARANVVTPWRPTAASAKGRQQPTRGYLTHEDALWSKSAPASSASATISLPPVCAAETPSEPAETSSGFTCGFELDYVLALARYMISGEPTWAMSQGNSQSSEASTTPAADETANLQAWLCPRGDLNGDNEEGDDSNDDDSTGDDETDANDDSEALTAARPVAGPLAALAELVPAADLAFDCLAPNFNYGSTTVSSLDTSANIVLDESLDTAVIDRAAIEAAQTFKAAAATEAELIAADLQAICPAAAARYNCGSPQACDPVIAAELGLAPRTTLEWWGAADNDQASAPLSNRYVAHHVADDYNCEPEPDSAPVVGSLANVLSDIREGRDRDFGLLLNAEVDAIAEWSNSIPAETAAAAPAAPVAGATAENECGFADPLARRADAHAEIRASIADAYFGAADLLFAGLNSQQSTASYPGDVIDAQQVISGAIRRAADNSADDDYPGDASDSVLFETLLAGPTRFVYLRRLPPSRWTMPIDWRAESLRIWDGGQGRWPLASGATATFTTSTSTQLAPLMVRQPANASPNERAITWPCLSADWTYVDQCGEQDVAINERAIEDAKALQRNALQLAADCADCLRALAGGIDAFARSLTLGQLDGLRSAALPQRALPLPTRDEYNTAPEIDAPMDADELAAPISGDQGSPEPRAEQQNWGIYLGL